MVEPMTSAAAWGRLPVKHQPEMRGLQCVMHLPDDVIMCEPLSPLTCTDTGDWDHKMLLFSSFHVI